MRRTPSQPIGEDLEWARGVVSRAWQADIGSSDGEVRFLMDMDRALSKYAARMFVSERQRAWLKRIEKRLDRAEEDEEHGGMTPVDKVLR